MALQEADIERFFPKNNAIHDAAVELCMIIINTTPRSGDQTTAIRKIREAVWTAEDQCESK